MLLLPIKLPIPGTSTVSDAYGLQAQGRQSCNIRHSAASHARSMAHVHKSLATGICSTAAADSLPSGPQQILSGTHCLAGRQHEAGSWRGMEECQHCVLGCVRQWGICTLQQSDMCACWPLASHLVLKGLKAPAKLGPWAAKVLPRLNIVKIPRLGLGWLKQRPMLLG